MSSLIRLVATALCIAVSSFVGLVTLLVLCQFGNSILEPLDCLEKDLYDSQILRRVTRVVWLLGAGASGSNHDAAAGRFV